MASYQLCADCNAPGEPSQLADGGLADRGAVCPLVFVDPSWASINRGVLLCNDCCSVHRVMGTHISHVRALNSTNWPSVLKEVGVTPGMQLGSYS